MECHFSVSLFPLNLNMCNVIKQESGVLRDGLFFICVAAFCSGGEHVGS